MINLKEMTISNTNESEFRFTENLTREVFWNLFAPGCSEHLILHKLRMSDDYIPDLDLVVKENNIILGHIIATKAKVITQDGISAVVLCAGPFSVAEHLQKKGIGSFLMNQLIDAARNLGYKGILLFGDPGYYPKFGYKNAQQYNITTKEGLNFDPFMALELQASGFSEIKGRFYESEAFAFDENELEIFDRDFQFKEKGKPRIDLSQFQL